MNRSEFDRRAEQISKQLDDIRGRLGELTSSYQSMIDPYIERGKGQLRTAADQAKSNIEQARSGVSEMNLPISMPNQVQWWIPVAAVACVACIVVLWQRFFTSESRNDVGQFMNDTLSTVRERTGTSNQYP